MFLLIAVVAGGVAWGLVEVSSIVRLARVAHRHHGMVMLVPSVSAATVVHPKALLLGGLGIGVRLLVAWYLSRVEVVDAFHRSE